MAKALTVSIIIPVYNEQDYLARCLDSIVKQTVKPLEVIVIDNNSTDGTVAIAKKYKFVKLLHERRQGQSWARNKGFKAARGDILARIDADSEIEADWIAHIRRFFTDSKLDAVTGLGITSVLPIVSWPASVLGSWLYFKWAEAYYGLATMWGSNMALRRRAWERVASAVICEDTRFHEDHDISLVLWAQGGVIIRDNSLRIRTYRQAYYYFPQVLEYMRKAVATKKRIKQEGFAVIPHIAMYKRVAIYVFLAPFAVAFYTLSLLAWPVVFVYRVINKH